MQLFISSPLYDVCAINLDDKRLNKQIIEICQVLSTAIWMENCNIAETLYSKGQIYLPTHEHHPICINARYHYLEICKLLFQCLLEWEYRFDKIHKCKQYIIGFILLTHLFSEYERRPFLNCCTHHKHIADIYSAYQSELNYKWSTDKVKPKWTRRTRPEF